MKRLLLALLIALFLAGCAGQVQTPTPTATARPTRTATPTRLVTATRTLPPSITPVAYTKISLPLAVAASKISISALGGGLSRMTLVLANLTDENIQLEVPAGTLFNPANTEVQTMVITKSVTIPLLKRANDQVQVAVACAAMRKKTPSNTDKLSYISTLNPALMRLLALPEFAGKPERVKQFAVWTVTDNPIDVKNYVGLSVVGPGAGPSQEELDQIRALFLKAGLYLDRYCIFSRNTCGSSLYTGAAVTGDRKWMALAHSDRALTLRSLETGLIEATIDTSPSSTPQINRPVAFSPDQKTIAVASYTAYAKNQSAVVDLIDISTRKLTQSIKLNLSTVSVTKFSPDGKSILIAGSAPGVQLWDPDGKTLQRRFLGQVIEVYEAVFSAAGDRLAVAGKDASNKRLLELWDVSTGKMLWANELPNQGVPLVFLEQGKSLATRHFETYALALWDTASGKIQQQLGKQQAMGGRPLDLRTAAVSADGQILGLNEFGLRLFNLSLQKEMSFPGLWFVAADFSPDGKSLTLYTLDGMVNLPVGDW